MKVVVILALIALVLLAIVYPIVASLTYLNAGTS